MKMTILLLLVTITASISTLSAEEESNSDDHYKKYCTEQAEQAGIENEDEFKQYVKDCLESYIGPTSE